MSQLSIALVAAVASNGVIGKGNRMPWNIPADLARFRRLTNGHSVVMGRKTWEGMRAPLPDRQNIVLSRTLSSSTSGIEIARSMAEACAIARLPGPLFIIGGHEPYRRGLQLARVMYLTEIFAAFSGDAYFPPFDQNAWVERSRERMLAEGCDFVEYVRAC